MLLLKGPFTWSHVGLRFFSGLFLALSLLAEVHSADGPTVSITRRGPTVELSWTATSGDFLLERSLAIHPAPVWQLVPNPAVRQGDLFLAQISPSQAAQFFRLRETAAFAQIVASSPMPEETGVAVTRETILRFDPPLAANSVLNIETLHATYGGRRILSRAEISTDRKTATLFYGENLPASARINVALNTDGLKNVNGQSFDGDGNGIAGGLFEMSFSTGGNTAVAGTAVIGHVFASELSAGGTNRPVEGVTITVDGAEETLRTVTDGAGFFRLQPSPAGRFFVHVDGRTAAGSEWPNGSYYPVVGKAWEAVAGTTTNLAAGNGLIYLPFIPNDALQPVSGLTDTLITFPPSVLATNPALAGVSINVPANTLFSDNGTRGGKVGIAPVPADRLPEPLPFGLSFPGVITIQTDGAQNFDRPVPVRFPNLPDPTTGEKLLPGAKTMLWSFNHDTGRWEAQGTATISADGNFAETDPGVGVRQPGWHGVNGACPGSGPEQKTNHNGQCYQVIHCTLIVPGAGHARCSLRCLGNVPLEIFSGKRAKLKRTAFETGIRCVGGPASCPPVPEDTLDQGRRNCMDRCVSPDPIRTSYAVPCEGFTDPCPRNSGLGALAVGDLPADRYVEQVYFWQVEGAYVAAYYGTTKILEIPPGDLPKFYALVDAFNARVAADSPLGNRLSPTERGELQALPRTAQFSQTEWLALIDRMESLQGSSLPADVAAALQKLDELVVLLKQRGWNYRLDGIVEGNLQRTAARSPAFGSESFPARAHFYLLKDDLSGFTRRGRLSASGQFEGIILPPDSYFTIAYYDPVTGKAGAAFFETGPAGSSVIIPTTPLEDFNEDETDVDTDGLPDIAEEILGTNPSNADTDGDGLRDGVEVSQGTNPLDGLAMQVGTIASLKTLGTAFDVAAFNNFAVVAEGTAGVSILDASNYFSPIRVAQVDTPGDARAVAIDGTLVAVADGSMGLAVIDISNLAASFLARQVPLSGNATAVTVAGGLAYVGIQSGSVAVVELATGRVLSSLTLSLPGLHDVLAVGDAIYALVPPLLVTLSFQGSALEVRSETAAGVAAPSFHSRRVRLNAGQGLLYAATVNGFQVFGLSDPFKPALLQTHNTEQFGWRQLVPNGSGLGVGVAGVNSNSSGDDTDDLYLQDLRPGETNRLFLTVLRTPGLAGALAFFNGLAYVADGNAGLQIVNYLAEDTQGVPPTVKLGTSIPLTPLARVEANSRAQLFAEVGDDVQVRNVQFYVDGTLVGTDGNFPFEASFITPLLTATKTNFTMRAKATDTGGNSTWSQELVIDLVPDATRPSVRRISPIGGDKVIDRVTAYFSEAIHPASFNPSTTQILSAGTDGSFGTADDTVVSASSYLVNGEIFSAELRFATPLPDGRYQLTLTLGVTDLNSNPIAVAVTHRFQVADATFWSGPATGAWNDPANWQTGRVPGTNDHVVIDLAGDMKIAINAGDITVASLETFEEIEITGGSITATGGWTAYGDVLLNGGGLRAGTLNLSSGARLRPKRNSNNLLQQMTVNGDIVMTPGPVSFLPETELHLRGGLRLNGSLVMGSSSTLRFDDSQTLAAGRIEFTGTDATVEIPANSTVTFSGDVQVHGRTGTISGGGTLLSLAKISADIAEGNLQIQPANWTHNGTAEVLNGGQLTFGGNWSGTGLVGVQNGTFNLGGQFGPLTTPITKTASSTVRISGIGNLQNSTLTLNALTGSWIIEGGTLRSGTLNLTEGTTLRPTRNSNNLLQQMTVNGDIVMTPGPVSFLPETELHLRGGLTLNGTLAMGSNSYLSFDESQTLVAGTIEFTGMGATGETSFVRHREFISCAGFSPDGQKLFTGSGDTTARVWDALTGDPLTPSLGHTNTPMHGLFSPDGRKLATIVYGREIRVWNIAPDERAIGELRAESELLTSQNLNPTGSAVFIQNRELLEKDWKRISDARRRETTLSNQTDAIWRRAETLAREAKWREALEAYSSALTQSPKEAGLWYERGRCYSAMTNWWEAREDFKSAIGLQINCPEFWEARARSEIALRDWTAAAVGFYTALRLQPDFTSAWNNRGDLCVSQTNWVDAILAFAGAREARSSILGEEGSPGGIPPRSAQATAHQLNLEKLYTTSLTHFYTRGDRATETFSDAPLGFQKLAGVDFDIRGAIRLLSTAGLLYLAPLPRDLLGIPVGQRCKRLHFLHSTVLEVPDGTLLATYVLQYANGEERELTIRYGQQMRDCSLAPGQPLADPNSALAWSVQPPRESGNQALYRTTWTNPLSDTQIVMLHLKSAISRSAPFVLAITLDEL